MSKIQNIYSFFRFLILKYRNSIFFIKQVNGYSYLECILYPSYPCILVHFYCCIFHTSSLHPQSFLTASSILHPSSLHPQSSILPHCILHPPSFLTASSIPSSLHLPSYILPSLHPPSSILQHCILHPPSSLIPAAASCILHFCPAAANL